MHDVAIYSRKSKFTGKGESIQNQIELCKEYAEKHFDAKGFLIYEDEGYTGGNTNRPMFKKLIEDIKDHKIKTLICYRLDRISRNISDFSRLIDLLEKYNVDFVSIREQFDTSTPMGRAMMYISSVFSHLERETIAERIKDNMYQLARTGRWLGGKTPIGFKSEPISYHDHEGNKKKMYKLVPVIEELDLVQSLFSKYIELKSLTQLESWTLENHIKTRNDKDFDKSALKVILSNPVYVVADQEVYEYFQEAGSDIASTEEDFDGTYGLMVFNKHDEKKNTRVKKDPSEWIVAIGKHEGVIPSTNWIRVQNILKANSKKSPRRDTVNIGLLLELLRCKHCGSKMKVSIYRKNNTSYHYYRCTLKERSRGSRCNIKNLNGELADRFVIGEITKISFKENDVHQFLVKLRDNVNQLKSVSRSKQTELEKNLEQYKSSIRNLTMQLAQVTDSSTSKYIMEQIKEFDNKINEVNSKLEKLSKEDNSILIQQSDISSLLGFIKDFANNIHDLSSEEKKKLLKQIVHNITWDGTRIEINIFDENTLI